MRSLLSLDTLDGRRATIAHSTRADGDLSPATVPADVLSVRRTAAVSAGPWHALAQVHGSRVLSVSADSEPGSRPQGDAQVTTASGRVLAVHSGDCVPVGLVDPGGVIGVAHAGWKGIESGVLGAAVRAIRSARPLAGGSRGQVVAAVGPHIHARAYEFGPTDLDRLADSLGEHVRAETDTGDPALDLTAATVGELERLGVEVAVVSPDCTATQADLYWSHRARAEAGRIALVVWLEPT